jgi:hypothetical protein
MAQQPPFFDASRLAFWHPDEYRIYVLPEELLFLRTAAYGPGAAWLRLRPRQEGRLHKADLDELRWLASRDPGSFVAAVDELADLRLGPPSRQRFAPFIYLLEPPTEHQAEFRFSHGVHGKYRLALFHPNAEKAYRELPRALGNRVAVIGGWKSRAQNP